MSTFQFQFDNVTCDRRTVTEITVRYGVDSIPSMNCDRYNMNCNPLKRSDGKNEDTSREGGGEVTIYDLLFADDSLPREVKRKAWKWVR